MSWDHATRPAPDGYTRHQADRVNAHGCAESLTWYTDPAGDLYPAVAANYTRKSGHRVLVLCPTVRSAMRVIQSERRITAQRGDSL